MTAAPIEFTEPTASHPRVRLDGTDVVLIRYGRPVGTAIFHPSGKVGFSPAGLMLDTGLLREIAQLLDDHGATLGRGNVESVGSPG